MFKIHDYNGTFFNVSKGKIIKSGQGVVIRKSITYILNSLYMHARSTKKKFQSPEVLTELDFTKKFYLFF